MVLVGMVGTAVVGSNGDVVRRVIGDIHFGLWDVVYCPGILVFLCLVYYPFLVSLLPPFAVVAVGAR